MHLHIYNAFSSMSFVNSVIGQISKIERAIVIDKQNGNNCFLSVSSLWSAVL